jgi:hypothetical protein
LEETPKLLPELANYYQLQIGVIHWIGQVNMITEVSKLASHMAMPREGHLQAMLHISSYLKKKHGLRMVFDPSYPDIDHTIFKECDWQEFYGDVKEAILANTPTPLGKEVDLRLFVDSDHAGDKLTQQSRTGFFIFVNGAPVLWMSKKQATIETSVFGAEFVVMKVGMEVMHGLWYKIQMMGVPLSGLMYIYADNMSVVHNTQCPESTLKKKSNSICYHAICELVAMGESLIGHCLNKDNMVDLATKCIGGGMKHDHLVGMLLHDIVDAPDA